MCNPIYLLTQYNYYNKDRYDIWFCEKEGIFIIEEYPRREFIVSKGRIVSRRPYMKRKISWLLRMMIGLVLGHMNNKGFKQPVIKGILDKSFLAFDMKTGETILGSIYLYKGYSIMLTLGSDTDLMKQIIDIYDPHVIFSINKIENAGCYAEYKRKGFHVCKRRATNRDLRYSFKKHVLYDLSKLNIDFEKLKKEIEL
jgi:hypothetical protein